MFTSFQTALSAMGATSTAIDVTGNNLANLNTTGFKQSPVSFHDLVAQSLSSLNQAESGFGVARAQSSKQFAQGGVQSTSGSLDAAVQGEGFFVLKNSSAGQLFTRAGNFKTDANGTLVTSTGEHVQGWTQTTANGAVNSSGPIGDIVLPTGTLRQPLATQNFSLDLNLNAAAAVGSADATFSAPMQVVDSLGASQTLTVTFTKTASNAWSYAVTIPATALTTAPTAPLATGNLTFGTNGQLLTPSAVAPSTSNLISVPVTGLADGAANLSLNWDLNTAAGASRITQFSELSATSASTQDGSSTAQLSGVAIGNGGAIMATYSSGQQRQVGQLALASIRNPDSLMSVGDNNYQITGQTALPVFGLPQTAGRGNILGGSLEASTVDIAREFTNLIVYQRSYQANAKVINTADQLTQETINIKQ